MRTKLVHEHIKNRLRTIHLLSSVIMIIFFGLFFYLGNTTTVDTIYTQMIVIIMALISCLGFISLLFPTEKEPKLPLFLFFILNILNTALVWSTGILQSPFIILFVILIIITSQLYHYGYALLQTLLAVIGLVFIYGATTYEILPYSTMLPYSDINILFQPTQVIIVYVLLYAFLLVFTVFSSSNNRVVLFRTNNKLDMDTTYQEKIIQEMPVGVLIVDSNLIILGGNPAATANFPFKETPCPLINYLSLPTIKPKKFIENLANNGETKNLTWKSDNGEIIPTNISAFSVPGKNKEDLTYILFLQTYN